MGECRGRGGSAVTPKQRGELWFWGQLGMVVTSAGLGPLGRCRDLTGTVVLWGN